MQSTMLLLALLTTQLSDPTGGRYPDTSPTIDAIQTETPATDSGISQGDAPASTAAQAAEEPAASQPSIFDEIDAAAEPLNNTEGAATDNPPSTSPGLNFGAQPSYRTQPPVTTESAAPETETDPAKVLAGLLEPPIEDALKGTKITLAQAVDNSLSRGDQTHRVIAYWDLSQAVANYYLSSKERTELAALRQGITLPSADWEVTRQATESRLALASDRVRVAQEHLALLMGNTTPGFAPLPADVPFCGPYETRYEQLFQSRPTPLAAQLNELLPRLHSDLAARTADIASARKWMFTVSDRRGTQSDGNELLSAYELFTARRRLFLSAVKEYNLGIVRYTELATPGTLDTERLVAMLIRTGSSPGTTLDREVQRANAEAGAGLNDSSSKAPTGGWNSATQNSTERSILVPRS